MEEIGGVKLLGFWVSPFVQRVKQALKLEGIQCEYIEEDTYNKSSLLLKLNPVHGRVAVLVHNGKPISESIIILEYIDEVWKQSHLLPQDPYERAQARFWAKFAEEKGVKLLGFWVSPYVLRVKWALKLKGIEYEYIEEDVFNKSPLLLKLNPVKGQVPVLVHDGKPISESTVILEYIDEVWKHSPLLPQDPYERANSRFWAKFAAEKLQAYAWEALCSRGEDHERAIKASMEALEKMEKELNGKKFFGGDKIGFVDLVAGFISYQLPVYEEIVSMKILDSSKFPAITNWINNFLNHPLIKEELPPKHKMLAYFSNRRNVILVQNSSNK